MFSNYFKIAWRNLVRNPGYSFINIGGLALGMTTAMLIGLWLHDELTYNRSHENFKNIVQLMQHQTVNGTVNTTSGMPIPLANALRQEYGDDFEHLSLSSWTWDHVLGYGDQQVSKGGAYVEESFPRMLSFKMISGSRSALSEPTSVLLSASTAQALFGTEDPLDKTIRIDNNLDVTVGGVYEDLPDNSSFNELKFVGSWNLYVTSESWLKVASEQWYNNSFQIFAQLPSHTTSAIVSDKIRYIKLKHSPEVKAYKPEVFVFPMKDWHLRSQWKDGMNTGGRIQMVWLFGTIGIFVLLLACINFMNLCTARSEKRAKEVGIRLAIGSVRMQLVKQFLCESFTIVSMGFLVATGALVAALPAFNSMADKKITVPWLEPSAWLMSILFVIVTGLLAGSYPAFYLSSFKPVRVLKGAYKAGRTASWPRKAMVIVQFTVSVALVIGTIVVFQQVRFTQNRPVGYNPEGLIMVAMSTPEHSGKYYLLQTELKSRGVVESMAQSSSPMGYIGSSSSGFSWNSKDPSLELANFATIFVSPDYGSTVGWTINYGRDFSTDFSTDSSAVILNEAAVNFMGIESPVGAELKWGDKKFHIIGVAENMIMESPYKAVRPTVHFLNRDNAGWMMIRLHSSEPVAKSITEVTSVFKKHLGRTPFEYDFADDVYAKKFEAEERVGMLIYVFAGLAIFISCLGLFGLASFVAEQRTKEIGIRKVLGANVLSLWKMLSTEFIVLVLVSCSIAVPLATYFLSDWLMKFEYRVAVSWWISASTVVAALMVTMATVSFQTLRSARMNPVKSLRSE